MAPQPCSCGSYQNGSTHYAIEEGDCCTGTTSSSAGAFTATWTFNADKETWVVSTITKTDPDSAQADCCEEESA